jgi:hypothetical protein
VELLVLAGGGLGNVVMTTPLLSALRDSGHVVDLALAPEAHRWEPVLDGFPAVRRVWRQGGRNAPPAVRPRHRLALQTVLGRPGGLGRRFPWPRAVGPSRGLAFERHEARVNLEMAERLGWAGPPPPAWGGGPADGPGGGRFAALLTGCNPAERWERKRLSGAFWRLLARSLTLPCVWLGGPADARPWMGGAGENLCGRLSLRWSLDLLARADLAVGVDCGLAHCAAALGVPTVVLFTATSEAKNRPWGPRVRLLARRDLGCRPCQGAARWASCVDWRCRELSVERVAEAAREG